MTGPNTSPGAGLVAVGSGITSFMLTAVVVIMVLPVAFSALIGLPIGAIAGLAVGLGLWRSRLTIGPAVRAAIAGYATPGPVVLALLALRYVNLGRDFLTVDVIVLVGVVSALGVGLGRFMLTSREY